ncbi:hypothetical protein [Modestobacter sp. SSW1-42]|uniref:hypothetical protein n=1 Tax=Modestobacter sp. SSW1-42 TaxID=596372 RepID=UPI003987F590
MRFSSPTRRAAGLLAVTTIGLSTAVLSVTGVASAADFQPDGGSYTFTSSAPYDGEDTSYDVFDATGLVIPTGYCGVEWDVNAAVGGSSSMGVKVPGHSRSGTTLVEAGQEYVFAIGADGGNATAPREEVVADPADESVVPAPAVAGAGGTGGAEGGQPGIGNEVDGWGGGGGGVTSISLDGEIMVSVHGGRGGSNQEEPDTGGSGGGVDVAPDGFDLGGPLADGARVSGTVVPCETPLPEPTDPGTTDPGTETPGTETPGDSGNGDSDGDHEYVTGAPQANWVSGVENGLEFQLWITTLDAENPVTGVEYTLDGGATWQGVATENMQDFQYSGTITGLEAGATYSVSFRFTTKNGVTEASETLTGRTAVPGPRDVKAVAGPASIKVSWTPPAITDEVAGYVVVGAPEGAQSSAGSIECQPTAALGTSCAMPAVPGTTYSLSVHSLDATGDKLGSSDWITVGPVLASSVASSLPKADGTLTSSDADGKVVAGEQITISGKDFLPGSTVDLVVYSTPVKLGTATVLADGTFSATVTLPKDLANGTHHLVASGVDVNGNPRVLVVEVTVSGGTAVLAMTGFSALPFAGAGALALIAGGGLLVVSRRRQAA